MSDTLLVGYDGSEGAYRAAELAKARAHSISARLIVAYVIEWSPYSFHTPDELEERHKRREEELERAQTKVLEPIIKKLETPGLAIETTVRHGHVAETLLQIGAEYHATQIFIGRLGHSRLQRLLFGSVATSLVQMSPIPITVVP